MCVLLLVCGLPPSFALAGETRVAVATNFLSAFKAIAERFEQETGHHILVSAGSSGKLYVQIQNGAPFDLFFSADAQRPELLEQEGLAVSGSRFTYAVGRLTLWSVDPLLIHGDGKTVLGQGKFQFLAIANPKTAPYGQAAVQTLKALKLWEHIGRAAGSWRKYRTNLSIRLYRKCSIGVCRSFPSVGSQTEERGRPLGCPNPSLCPAHSASGSPQKGARELSGKEFFGLYERETGTRHH